MKKPISYYFTLNEHRVSLFDEKYPSFGFAESRNFDYLNFDTDYKTEELAA